jgi:hypothetical protein
MGGRRWIVSGEDDPLCMNTIVQLAPSSLPWCGLHGCVFSLVIRSRQPSTIV